MSGRPDVGSLRSRLHELRGAMTEAATARHAELHEVHPAHRRSALNLVHYLALRARDVRGLQADLAEIGLSSLGNAEPHVLASVDAVAAVLARLECHDTASIATDGLGDGVSILAANAERLLGRSDTERTTRVMVTLPTEAATDAHLVSDLVAHGMDIARVNCAHDDPEVWASMIAQVLAAPRTHGGACRIAMDLGGPKLRTGPIARGPKVVKVRPRRDTEGVVVEQALVWLTVSGSAPRPPTEAHRETVVIPVAEAKWLRRRRAGDVLRLKDTRGSRRRWDVIEANEVGCLATASKTAYVGTGTRIVCVSGRDPDPVRVGEMPAVVLAHRVHVGDRVVLTRSLAPSVPAPGGHVHRIGCTLPEAFDRCRVGERVWLDDGKLGGSIEAIDDDEITVLISDARPGGSKLKAVKGINLPDTDLKIGALTDTDRAHLRFISRHADLVNYSFVRTAHDVAELQAELETLDATDLGIILKIENVEAFENLPQLLLTAMRSERLGVMIARGDLAVEVGFERLSEVQEEIMHLCEAAHVPVIWATQVLETLAKKGRPSRAEVSDAAMSERAECVMLNKGPHIVEALDALNSILTRMQTHQHKNRSLLRQLHAFDTPTP